MDKASEIGLRAQLAAIEYLVTMLHAHNYMAKGYSRELIESMHKLRIEQARQETYPTGEPALSDHVSGEFETELDRLQRAILEIWEAAQPK